MMAKPIKNYSIIYVSLVAAVICKYQLFDYPKMSERHKNLI